MNRIEDLTLIAIVILLSCKVLGCSCVDGEGVDLLHAFLKKLRPRHALRRRSSSSSGSNSRLDSLEAPAATASVPSTSNNGDKGDNKNGAKMAAAAAMAQQRPLHFQVHKTWSVGGVGPVLFGTMLIGKVKVGYQLLMGPMEDGSFSPVRVKSIRRSHVPVKKLTVGQTGTLALELEFDLAPSSDSKSLRDDSSSKSETSAAKRESSPAIDIPLRVDHVAHALRESQRRSQSEPSLPSCSVAIHQQQGQASFQTPSSGTSGSAGSPASPRYRKGLALTDALLKPSSERSFRAVVKLVLNPEAPLDDSANLITNSCGNEGSDFGNIDISAYKDRTVVVHCGSIRQAATIVACR